MEVNNGQRRHGLVCFYQQQQQQQPAAAAHLMADELTVHSLILFSSISDSRCLFFVFPDDATHASAAVVCLSVTSR